MRAVLAATVAVVLVLAGSGRAATTVLRPRPSAGTTLPGIRNARAFDVDRAALAELRKAGSARLEAFPVGGKSRALELERFDPLARTRIEAVGARGVRRLSPPDLAYFRGRIAGEPDSIAIVTVGRHDLRALVIGADGTAVVGPAPDGTHRAWALADVDTNPWTPPAAFCMNDLVNLAQPGTASAARTASAPATASATGALGTGLRHAQVAIETDQELRAKFASDDETLAYIASIFVEASAIYERDLEIALDLSYVRIWDTTDPWSSSVPDGQLSELQSYWNNPANNMSAIAGPRDIVHMISGKPVLGGIAYINAVCNASYGYGVSQVYGSFDTIDPHDTWDLVVVAHELGHGFGTPHTHCYQPPIDTCYNAEPGCYSGPETASQGTLMSYCHLHAGGLANIDLRFHDRVRALLATTTAAQTCLAYDASSTCGDGVLDAGEECDDGNRVSGDGCSGGCLIEACGNGRLDLGEGCDDGNTVGGDGCSASCELELCGDGVVTGNEECDDGNTVAGDGCSPTCHIERCALLIPYQQVWSSSRLVVKPRATGPSALTFRAAFEIPANGVVDAAGAGLQLLGETATGATGLSIVLPGGEAWTVRGTRIRYRDASAAVQGVKKAVVVAKPHGDRTRVKVVVVGSGGDYPATVADMPARLTVVFGGDQAGATGACGQWQPTYGACRSERGGKRLVCH
jgi:cysteine-rich repeat protein